MRISKLLLYCNVAALTINAIMILLTMMKILLPILGIVIFLVFLISAVWLSCLINDQLPKKT